MAGTMLQRPVDVSIDIRRKAELAAGFQHTMETGEVDVRNEAALPVLLLRPRIGIKQIDMIDRSLRQPVEQLRRIIVVKADIHQLTFADRGEQLGHGIHEGLDADETRLGIFDRAVGEMLAAAETDLQTDRSHIRRKESDEILRGHAFQIDFQQRQQILDRINLLIAQGLSLASAKKRFRCARTPFFRHLILSTTNRLNPHSATWGTMRVTKGADGISQSPPNDKLRKSPRIFRT
ncbi:hypothetical protein AGR8A_Cc60538 [Agrobacterium fabrum str. J-07]|nr:hypothetical protein AGR8A_Cc60538 [Agrobacterium fabrum str. J-07]